MKGLLLSLFMFLSINPFCQAASQFTGCAKAISAIVNHKEIWTKFGGQIVRIEQVAFGNGGTRYRFTTNENGTERIFEATATWQDDGPSPGSGRWIVSNIVIMK